MSQIKFTPADQSADLSAPAPVQPSNDTQASKVHQIERREQPEGYAIALAFGNTAIKKVGPTGIKTERLMNKQEFKLANPKLQGNALTCAFNTYHRENGTLAKSGALALIGRPGTLIRGHSFNPKNGTGCIRYGDSTQLVDPVDAPAAKPATLDEQLGSMKPEERATLLAKYLAQESKAA